MALFRFRLRTLMIVLALLALPLGTWCRVEGMRLAHRRRGDEHFRRIIALGVGFGPGNHGYGLLGFKRIPPRPLTPLERVRDRWHFALLMKNDAAARHAWSRPWRSIAPEPPEPRWPKETTPAWLRSPRLHRAAWKLASILGLGYPLGYAEGWWTFGRQERIYRGLIAQGDPNGEYCREEAEIVAETKRWMRRRLLLWLGQHCLRARPSWK
jgi:hypothetical protein